MGERRIISLEQEAGRLLGDNSSGALVLVRVLGGSTLPLEEEILKEAAKVRIDRVGGTRDLDSGLDELIERNLAQKVNFWQLTPKGNQILDMLFFPPSDPNSQ